MNRYMVGMLLGLLLFGVEPVESQAVARVVYRNGNLGVSVAIGDIPIRVTHRHGGVMGRVAVEPGRSRVVVGDRGPYWQRGTLKEGHLRQLLGKHQLRRLERHARASGLRGPLRGQWFQLDRRTMVLEVTVRGALVAEAYDYGRDGYLDEMVLLQSRGYRGVHPKWRGNGDDRYDDDRH